MKKNIIFTLILSFVFSLNVFAMTESEAKNMASNYKSCNEISKASFSSKSDLEQVCHAKGCGYNSNKCFEIKDISTCDSDINSCAKLFKTCNDVNSNKIINFGVNRGGTDKKICEALGCKYDVYSLQCSGTVNTTTTTKSTNKKTTTTTTKSTNKKTTTTTTKTTTTKSTNIKFNSWEDCEKNPQECAKLYKTCESTNYVNKDAGVFDETSIKIIAQAVCSYIAEGCELQQGIDGQICQKKPTSNDAGYDLDYAAEKYSSCQAISDDDSLDPGSQHNICSHKDGCSWDDTSNTCTGHATGKFDPVIECTRFTLESECNHYKKCTWSPVTQKCYDEINCEQLLVKEECDSFRKCQWKNNECTERYVANKPCEEASVKKVLRLFGYLIQLLRLAIPLIIIILGTFDVYEAVVDKDEKLLGKKIKQLGIRIIGGVFIFFIPTILNAIFVLSDKLNIMSTSEYQACETCLLKPSKCVINESEEENNNNNNNSNNSNNSNNNTNFNSWEECEQNPQECAKLYKTCESTNYINKNAGTYDEVTIRLIAKAVCPYIAEGCNFDEETSICQIKPTN